MRTRYTNQYNPYSRRSKIEEAKNKKRAYFFIVLTAIAVIIIFFYGLPAVVKFAAFLTEINQSSQPIDANDETPPPPPRLSNLPAATKDKKVEVKGNTEAGAKVTIYFNDEQEEIVADSSGNFGISIELKRKENSISAIATDTSGNKSQKSEIQRIIYDTEPPPLEISKPADNSEFYGSRQRQLVIEGTTEENANLQINQRWVVVESGGSFTFTTTLQDGENKFTAVSEDAAGNKTEITFAVTYSP